MTMDPELLRRQAAFLDGKGSASTADGLRAWADRLEEEDPRISMAEDRKDDRDDEREWAGMEWTGGAWQ